MPGLRHSGRDAGRPGEHMTALTLGPAPAAAPELPRRIRLLVAATITYNVIEAVVAITAGTAASSTALIGFGLDSVIEVASAAAVAWQFSAADPESPGDGPRCGSSRCRSSPWPPTSPSTPSARCSAPARPSTPPSGLVLAARQPGGHAAAVRRPTARRPRTRLRHARWPTPSRPCCAPTCPAVLLVGLALNSRLRLVLGRPDRRPGHRRRRRQGRPRGLARGRLLRPSPRP